MLFGANGNNETVPPVAGTDPRIGAKPLGACFCYRFSGLCSVRVSAKPVGAGAMSQPWTATGEQFGLLTHTAATESGSLRADEKLTAFVEFESAIPSRSFSF